MGRWIWIVAALVALFLGCSREGYSNIFTLVPDSTYADKNNMITTKNSTLAACTDSCEIEGPGSMAPFCKGVMYNEATKTCQMKGEIGSAKTSTPGINTYLKKQAALAKIGYQLGANNNYVGHDISVIEKSTSDKCSDLCTAKTECKGYVFDRRTDKCSLKNDFGLIAFSDGFDMYKKIPPASPPLEGYALEESTVYDKGSVFIGEPIQNTTSDKCMAACTANTECLAGVFVPINNMCFLHKELGSPKVLLSGYNTYKKIPKATQVPTDTVLPAGWRLFESNTQYDGKFETKAVNMAECMTACSGMPGCVGIGSESSDCRLYTSFSDAKSENSGYNTYKYTSPDLGPEASASVIHPLRRYNINT